MDLLGKVISWLVSIFFIVFGITMAVYPFYASIFFISIGLLYFPPLRNFLASRVQTRIGFKQRIKYSAFLGLAFFISLGYESELIGDKANQERLAQEKLQKEMQRQQELDYFASHREEIYSSAKRNFEEKKYNLVLSSLQKYMPVQDKEVTSLFTMAQSEITKLNNKKRSAGILEQLKTIPAAEVEKNLQLYKELQSLNPNVAKYKDKVQHYSLELDKLNKERKKAELAAKAAADRKKLIERQFSPWDGSHRNIEAFVKKNMHDPDSFEHDETKYWDMGTYLVVNMSYRGKNAFGGKVRNFIKVKVGLDGTLLEVIDGT